MLLAIDAGNSTVSFGFLEGDSLEKVFKAETRKGATSDEYRVFLHGQMAMAGIDPTMVNGIAISCVVPHLVGLFFEALKGISDASPLLVSTRLKLGIKINYNSPETLGPDRIASASAAYKTYGGPVIVVDCGTATTFSVVDGSGAFLGGAISPGLLTGYDALTTRASSLPRVGLTFPKNAIGRSTGEGVQSGIILGHAAMVGGLIEMLRSELGSQARAVATGGLSDMVAPHVKGLNDTDPHLTLKGLAGIYRLNSGN